MILEDKHIALLCSQRNLNDIQMLDVCESRFLKIYTDLLVPVFHHLSEVLGSLCLQNET